MLHGLPGVLLVAQRPSGALVYSLLRYGLPGGVLLVALRYTNLKAFQTGKRVSVLRYTASLLHGVPGVLLVALRPLWCTPRCCTASLVYSSLRYGLTGVLGLPGVLLVALRPHWCTPRCCTASLVYSSLRYGLPGEILTVWHRHGSWRFSAKIRRS